MALQVGSHCYATAADAAAAACALVPPQSVILSTGSVFSSSCGGTTGPGSYLLRVRTTDPTGVQTALVDHVVTPAFQTCRTPDYVAGAEAIGSALLGVWALCWGVYRIHKLIDTYRGGQTI